MDWNSLWALLQAAGLPGLVIGVVVLLFVYLGEFTNIFPNPTFKRLAAIIASALFAGLPGGTVLAALTAALSLLISTGLNLAIKYLASKSVPAK